jgi:photosystem II stability/assembly factor-like uncharacterized protein
LKISSFKNTRIVHKWIGILSVVFILILSISGFLLMHPKELGFDQAQISGKYLPKKYFQVHQSQHPIQALVANSAIYAGTDIGIYRSQDDGKSWLQINQGLFDLNIHALVINPKEVSTLYAGTHRGIFKSEDAGDTWSEWFDESSGLTHSQVNDLALNPDHPEILFAATHGGIFKSLDAGESWVSVYTEHAMQIIKFSALNPDIIYASGGNGTLRSKNNGRDWSRVWENEMPTLTSLVSLKTDPEFLYAGSLNGFFKSFNAGRNWELDPNLKTKPINAIFIKSPDLSKIYLGSGVKFYTSNDGGDSWEMLSSINRKVDNELGTSVDMTITKIAGQAGKALFIGTTSGLYVSENEGHSWESIDLSGAVNQLSQDEMKMDVVKLITEIHTGRFFGSYFYLLVDVSTFGLIFLTLTGILITYYRAKLKNRIKLTEDMATDRVIQLNETTDELATESNEIHDMIEHITEHIEKCQLVYMDQEKKEIEEVSRHLNTLDKKMHRLMENLRVLEKDPEV